MNPASAPAPQPADPSPAAPRRAESCARSLAAIAQTAPRVHCITNAVAMSFSANALLAVGATPAMSLCAEELPDFVSSAASLAVNIGTLDAQRRRAIDVAVGIASRQGKPWVMDPVMVDVSSPRLRYARELLRRAPQAVRGNQAEIAALAGGGGAGAAQRLARDAGTVVAQTGAVDVVTDGRRTLAIANGQPLMTRVTAMGCAATALLAAFLAVEADALDAAAQGLLALGVAADLAGAEDAAGPGSFAVRLLDRLYGLDRQTLERLASVS